MTYTKDAELKYIADGIRDKTLPKPEWTHAAHFAAAIWLLDEDSCDPFTDMPGIIREYNEATGVQNTDTDGYHETITLASLKAAEHVMSLAGPGTALFECLNTLLAGPYGQSDWVLKHWSKPVLFSVEARRNWVAPDRTPLRFGD